MRFNKIYRKSTENSFQHGPRDRTITRSHIELRQAQMLDQAPLTVDQLVLDFVLHPAQRHYRRAEALMGKPKPVKKGKKKADATTES